VAQNIHDDDVTLRFGESLLRSTCLCAGCVDAFAFVAFVHFVRSARVVIISGHSNNLSVVLLRCVCLGFNRFLLQQLQKAINSLYRDCQR
jgi:hypothetical protein